jgi:hypothetical protein
MPPSLVPPVAPVVFPPASGMDILFTAAQIADRVAVMGRQITADY